MEKKWYDEKRYAEDKEYRQEIIKANVTILLIRLIFTSIFGIIFLLSILAAMDEFSQHISQISLAKIFEIILSITMIYLISKVWSDKDQY